MVSRSLTEALFLLQARGLFEALENENQTRREHSSGSDILCSLEDLQLEEAKKDFTKLSQGHRLQLTLGGQGTSSFIYKAVLLDSHSKSGPFLYHCGVFIVPKVCLDLPIWLMHWIESASLHVEKKRNHFFLFFIF